MVSISMAARGDTNTLAISLNTYATRNYVYNNQFANSTIPFLPSIANIVSWREVADINEPFPP